MFRRLLPLLIGAVFALPAVAQPEPRSTQQAIQEFCQFLARQSAFTVEMDITYDERLEIGAKVQYSAYQRVALQKPNRLRSEYVGDERVTTFYYDGQTMTLQAPNQGYYLTKPAPATLDQLLEQIEDKYGVTLPLSNLWLSDPCQAMTAFAQNSLYIGADLVEREPQDHILLVGEDRDVQLWLTQAQPPLLKKVVITYKQLPGAPQYTAVFSNWNFSPQSAPETFRYTPVKDDIPVEFLPKEGLPD